MKITDTIIEQPVYGYKFPQNKEEILFLDIETTGLSPDASSLYMIGVMYFDTAAGSWHIKQFFADNYKSEAEILLAFLNILVNYNYLYHFNGKTFDIPYILNKFRKYNIKPDMHCSRIFNNTDTEYSIDILALIRPLKKLLSIKKPPRLHLSNGLGLHVRTNIMENSLFLYIPNICSTNLLPLPRQHNLKNFCCCITMTI